MAYRPSEMICGSEGRHLFLAAKKKEKVPVKAVQVSLDWVTAETNHRVWDDYFIKKKDSFGRQLDSFGKQAWLKHSKIWRVMYARKASLLPRLILKHRGCLKGSCMEVVAEVDELENRTSHKRRHGSRPDNSILLCLWKQTNQNKMLSYFQLCVQFQHYSTHSTHSSCSRPNVQHLKWIYWYEME